MVHQKYLTLPAVKQPLTEDFDVHRDWQTLGHFQFLLLYLSDDDLSRHRKIWMMICLRNADFFLLPFLNSQFYCSLGPTLAAKSVKQVT